MLVLQLEAREEVIMSEGVTKNSSQCSETEKEILKDWIEILRVENIDMHDNFFDLGGDSLAAMLCISRMRTKFGIEFPLDSFFLDDATISDFARAIERFSSDASRGSPLP